MPLIASELEAKLWKAADILRGQIDAAYYKNYIFSMLFFRYVAPVVEEEQVDIAEVLAELGYTR